MRPLLLLISLCWVTACCDCGTTKPVAKKAEPAAVANQKPDSVGGSAAPTRIEHPAPNQAQIDSVKNEKAKKKK
jgi:hypothetical protein